MLINAGIQEKINPRSTITSPTLVVGQVSTTVIPPTTNKCSKTC